MTIEAGLIIAALSLILGYLGYSLNKNKSIKDEGKQDAVISTKLDNIERGVQDIRIDIKANEKIGFVGKSGVGKTTIFNLITKLYNVDSGEILFDGYGIDDLDCNSLRDNMSIITQNPYIFNFSIKSFFVL